MGRGGGRTVVACRVEVVTWKITYKLPSKKPQLNGSAQVFDRVHHRYTVGTIF